MKLLIAIMLSLIMVFITIFLTCLLYELYGDKIDEATDRYFNFIESLAEKIRKEN